MINLNDINGNVVEVMNELHKGYKLFTEYQERMTNAFGVFYCTECQKVHPIEEKQRGQFLCKTVHKRREAERVRKYRERKKRETLEK